MLPLLLLLAAPPAFEAYLDVDGPVADGFDLPLQDGDPAAKAIAHGRVVEARGGRVLVEHVFYENHRKRTVRSRYAGLREVGVASGDTVSRGQILGRIARGFDGRSVRLDGAELGAFVRDRRTLFVPQEEPVLVLVHHATHALAIYEEGELAHTAEIGFGQRAGRKRRQGDLKTPKGMYFVVSKYRGKIDKPYGEYFGGHWIKLNYPNAFDAAFGVEHELIRPRTAERIARNWRARRLTNQKTRLGGGIGFHGWAGPWSWEETGYLSWGCIVFHNEDMKRLYDQIPKDAMVIIR